MPALVFWLRCVTATMTGEGQQIDLALVDAQIAWLINEGVNYLTSGDVPQRRGNGHPNIVPYEVYQTADGHVILAVGNDSQFKRFCGFIEKAGACRRSPICHQPGPS